MVGFNGIVLADDRVESVILPIADGLTLARRPDRQRGAWVEDQSCNPRPRQRCAARSRAAARTPARAGTLVCGPIASASAPSANGATAKEIPTAKEVRAAARSGCPSSVRGRAPCPAGSAGRFRDRRRQARQGQHGTVATQNTAKPGR